MKTPETHLDLGFGGLLSSECPLFAYRATIATCVIELCSKALTLQMRAVRLGNVDRDSLKSNCAHLKK